MLTEGQLKALKYNHDFIKNQNARAEESDSNRKKESLLKMEETRLRHDAEQRAAQAELLAVRQAARLAQLEALLALSQTDNAT